MRADADDAALVKVFGGVLADVGDVGCEFLHTALGLAHFERVFIDMNRSQDVVAHDTLVEHDGVLIVVTFPRHERNFEIAAEGEFTLLGCITFGENIAFLDTLTGLADRTEVDCHALVGLAPLGNIISLDSVLECDEFFVFGAVIADADGGCVDIFDCTGSLSHNLSAGVAGELGFDAGAHDGRLAAHEGNGLTHHVRAHERTVGVVMFKERNE